MNKFKVSSSLIISFILGGFGIVMYLLYVSSESPLEKIIMAFIFLSFMLPISLNYIVFISRASIKAAEGKVFENDKIETPKVDKNTNSETNKNNNLGNNKDGSIRSNLIHIKSHKSKVINDEEYINLRNVIINSSKNRIFNRDDILRLKCEVDYLLGIHKYNYQNFNFDNDLHEIYAKIKSSHFKTDDYTYLLNFISEIIGNKSETGNF